MIKIYSFLQVDKLLYLYVKFMSERSISNCEHVILGRNTCKRCGLYLHQANPAIKTALFDTVCHSSAPKFVRNLRKRTCSVLPARELHEGTSILLEAICDKFQYSLETLALGVYVFMKSCEKQEKDEKFWAASALLVASKGIELDKRVPYLNRYQRYADKSFTQEDYELAEKTIFEEMNFNIQFSTFVTFVNFYLTCGVVFKSDGCSNLYVRTIEDEILARARMLVRRGDFIQHEPEKLALSLVKEYRMKNRLEGWNDELIALTGFTSDQIKLLDRTDILKPLRNLDTRMKPRQPLTLQSSYQTTNTSSTKPVKFSRKRLQNTLKIHNSKQNSMKLFQPSLNLIRNQTFSTAKYPTTFSLCQSTQRIIPVNTLVNRRC